MMPEYQRATVDALKAETTKVVIVHDSFLKIIPEWLRKLVTEELTARYRALAFESKDVFFGMTTIYVRVHPIAWLSPHASVTGLDVPCSTEPDSFNSAREKAIGEFGGLLRL